MTGTAVKTNGIGQKTTAHLNTTVSLRDWAGKNIPARAYPQIKRERSQ